MEIFAAQCRAWHGRLASGVSSIIAHDAGLLEKVHPSPHITCNHLKMRPSTRRADRLHS
ncbi:uncharacterized protein RCC_12212 [Ramularia collo-cygni]|uniref:Uncharacterized protein n=1 Tax=Ramularia collo-cygni TaxID=112498 RepID=A0A2D3V642_9PEZI|nr:uncharacterized protein RCC_12212 [Ramularia collo-cygni]CZT16949.1 uncharacterized protein RCC_12212 [Ramularia collo-cygni]